MNDLLEPALETGKTSLQPFTVTVGEGLAFSGQAAKWIHRGIPTIIFTMNGRPRFHMSFARLDGKDAPDDLFMLHIAKESGHRIMFKLIGRHGYVSFKFRSIQEVSGLVSCKPA